MLQVCLTYYSQVLLFYTPWKQKTFSFSDVLREYRKVTSGCNGLIYNVFDRNVKEMSKLMETLSTKLNSQNFYLT